MASYYFPGGTFAFRSAAKDIAGEITPGTTVFPTLDGVRAARPNEKPIGTVIGPALTPGCVMVALEAFGVPPDRTTAAPQPDECRHCGCPSPESPCHYCGTRATRGR